MGTIKYTKTTFREPGRIDEQVYWTIKKELARNPHFEIDPSSESFTQHFSGLLKTAGICLLIGIFCFALFKDGNPMIAVGGICIMIFIVCVIFLFLEGPSYATYIKNKQDYFSRMKYAIQNSNSYNEFHEMFYSK